MAAGDAGTYVGNDGNWYDAQGNNLGPSGQSPQGGQPIPSGAQVAPGNPSNPGIPPPPTQNADGSFTFNGGIMGGRTASLPGYTGGGGGGTQSVGGPIAPFSGVTYPQFQPPPLPASLQKQFTLPTAEDLRANDPGYQERFDMGRQAIERGAAAQGSILSGGTLKGLEQYGQNYASGEYNNYVNQQLQQRQQQASDYLNLAYGPSWQQNQGAVNQYGQLYSQYQDLINNNRNAQNDYINALLQQENIGVGAARAGQAPASSGSV